MIAFLQRTVKHWWCSGSHHQPEGECGDLHHEEPHAPKWCFNRALLLDVLEPKMYCSNLVVRFGLERRYEILSISESQHGRKIMNERQSKNGHDRKRFHQCKMFCMFYAKLLWDVFDKRAMASHPMCKRITYFSRVPTGHRRQTHFWKFSVGSEQLGQSRREIRTYFWWHHCM